MVAPYTILMRPCDAHNLSSEIPGLSQKAGSGTHAQCYPESRAYGTKSYGHGQEMKANRKENSQEQGALTRPAIQRHSYANKNGLGADGAEETQPEVWLGCRMAPKGERPKRRWQLWQPQLR